MSEENTRSASHVRCACKLCRFCDYSDPGTLRAITADGKDVEAGYCMRDLVVIDRDGSCASFRAKRFCGECRKFKTIACNADVHIWRLISAEDEYCGDEHFEAAPCSECLYYNDRSNCALIDEWYDAEGAERGRNLTYARCFRSRRIEKGDGTE